MKEIWKDIAGYEDLYQVSNLGNVRSLPRVTYKSNGRVCHYKGKILKPVLVNAGYLRVILAKDGINDCFYVHRLVATMFVANPHEFPQINHKNENKTDNRAENLEWCTCKYNVNYGSHNEKCKKALSKEVYQCDDDGNVIAVFPSTIIAGLMTGIHRVGIGYSAQGRRNKNGTIKKAGGYLWKYKE